MAILIPELILKRFIEGLLLYVKKDWFNHTDKTETLLYEFFYGQVNGKFDYYEQAQKLFTRDDSDVRKIAVREVFDVSRAGLPTIHLSLPAESPGKADGIGIDEGYEEPSVDLDKSYYARTFDSTYNVVITSDNTNEVLLIYNTLRALIISAFDTIELNGFRNVRISGADLTINQDIVPPGIFLRAIRLSGFYTLVVRRIFDNPETLNDIIIEGEMIDESE